MKVVPLVSDSRPAPIRSDRDIASDARDLIRQWLAGSDSDILSAIDAIGRRAISGAADASARLERGMPAQSAQDSLQQLQALALSLDAPPKKWSLFARRDDKPEDGRQRFEALVESLDKERDAVARSLILLETDRGRLAQAAAALDEAVRLVRACGQAVEATARELRFDRPERAAFFRETAAARLLGREQDILTQAAVTQQGILTLGLLTESQTALSQALERARETSVAALRTAIAARRAVEGSQSIARQADALERAVDASGDAGARSNVQHLLDDAIAQARKAIDAAEAGRRPL